MKKRQLGIIIMIIGFILIFIGGYSLIDSHNKQVEQYMELKDKYNELIIEYNNSLNYNNEYELRLEKYYKEYNQLLDGYTCDIYYGREHISKKPVGGLYWVGKDYYCVWADLLDIDAIEETDRHEYCHYLVDNDYEHFCFKS